MLDVVYWLEWYDWAKHYLFNGGGYLPLQSAQNEPIHVLMNGPSIKETIHYVEEKPGKVIMINQALLNLDTLKVKPDYYCFIDPMYADISLKPVADLYNCIQTYNDNLTVYSLNYILKRLNITNPNIKTNYICNNPCPEYRGKKECNLLKKNKASFNFQGGVIAALYVAIQLGYKKIYLHGADSNSIKNIELDKDKQMVFVYDHYYEEKKVKKLDYDMKTSYKISYTLFKELYSIKKYADDLGVNIINMSPVSWIDCFDRFLS